MDDDDAQNTNNMQGRDFSSYRLICDPEQPLRKKKVQISFSFHVFPAKFLSLLLPMFEFIKFLAILLSYLIVFKFIDETISCLTIS